jgi:hypothetical protein
LVLAVLSRLSGRLASQGAYHVAICAPAKPEPTITALLRRELLWGHGLGTTSHASFLLWLSNRMLRDDDAYGAVFLVEGVA